MVHFHGASSPPRVHRAAPLTLGEAIEQWLDVADLEVTTRERYKDLVRIYIAPRLGTQQAEKIDAELHDGAPAPMPSGRTASARRAAHVTDQDPGGCGVPGS